MRRRWKCGVLAEWEHTLGSDLRVAEHGERHELVVFSSLRIVKDLSHHFVVLPAQHEGAVVGSGVGDDGQSFGVDHKHLVAVPVFCLHIVFSDELVFGSVRAELKRFLIMKRFCCHYFGFLLGCQIMD